MPRSAPYEKSKFLGSGYVYYFFFILTFLILSLTPDIFGGGNSPFCYILP